MALLEKIVWGASPKYAVSGFSRTVAAALALLLLPVTPVWAQARLSRSLRAHVASKSTQPVDVIVHGTPDEVRAIATRHELRIKKMLTEGAVLLASAAGISALSADVDHLSRDVEVTSFMSVSNAAIGADQVQAGLEGLAGFTGAGVGVAIIDSGVWAGHSSLAGRVVYSKDFISGPSAGHGRNVAAQGEDAYGHGTHIG